MGTLLGLLGAAVFIYLFVKGWERENIEFSMEDVVFDEHKNNALRLYVRTMIEEETGDYLKDYSIGYCFGSLKNWIVADIGWKKRKIVYTLILTDEQLEEIEKKLAA